MTFTRASHTTLSLPMSISIPTSAKKPKDFFSSLPHEIINRISSYFSSSLHLTPDLLSFVLSLPPTHSFQLLPNISTSLDLVHFSRTHSDFLSASLSWLTIRTDDSPSEELRLAAQSGRAMPSSYVFCEAFEFLKAHSWELPGTGISLNNLEKLSIKLTTNEDVDQWCSFVCSLGIEKLVLHCEDCEEWATSETEEENLAEWCPVRAFLTEMEKEKKRAEKLTAIEIYASSSTCWAARVRGSIRAMVRTSKCFESIVNVNLVVGVGRVRYSRDGEQL